eukprot:COSAG06_NODE_12258_length_1396_cov_1.049847_1_plen_81_part_00
MTCWELCVIECKEASLSKLILFMSLQFQQQAFELSSLFLSKSCDSLYQHSHLQGLHVDQQPEALHTQDKQAEESIGRNDK